MEAGDIRASPTFTPSYFGPPVCAVSVDMGGAKGAINILNNDLDCIWDGVPGKVKAFIDNYNKFSCFCPEVITEFEKKYLSLKQYSD